MIEKIIQTSLGPVALRVGQVYKLEGVPIFLEIESIGDVPRGTQIRTYLTPEKDAQNQVTPMRAVAPNPEVETSDNPEPSEQQENPGDPETVEDATDVLEAGPLPITGLTEEEIQDGLASGLYTQNENGEVFRNPDSDGDSPEPNHLINQ